MMKFVVSISLAFPFSSLSVFAQGASAPTVTIPSTSGYLTGSWAYRSFVNDADLTDDVSQLLFGAGTLTVTESLNGAVQGTIGGQGWSLNITGNVTYSKDAAFFLLEGQGTVGGEKWIYDYSGYATPKWSNGVKQIDALVGTVVRTVAHSGGAAKAGFTASFYAVRAP